MRMYYAVGKFSPFQTKSIPLCSSPSGTELVLYRHSLRSISHNKIQSSILISIYSKTLVFNKVDSHFYLHQLNRTIGLYRRPFGELRSFSLFKRYEEKHFFCDFVFLSRCNFWTKAKIEIRRKVIDSWHRQLSFEPLTSLVAIIYQ